MDYKKLKIHQTDLLNLYKSLCEILDKEGREIDLGLKATRDNVEAERFLLAIFGEVKSGKSTFINALLKEAILPSDDLQATSEIIEVCKSDKKKAEVTFVNGRHQVIENEVVRSLKDIASLNEEYRYIPIVQVNRFLSDHYSKEEGKAVFDEEELETFLSSDLENINKLNDVDFRNKIREYIEQNISCDKIPAWVSLYYPHDVSEFKHFRIVDTPGVKGIGGIEERTEGFINQADAVICFCNAKQLESTTLGDILENDIPENVKRHLILVLTHRSNFPSNEQRNRILDHANSILTIGSDNVFFVDSLTELDLQNFYGAKTTDEINAIRGEDQQLRGRTAHFFEEANGNRSAFLKLLEEQANFREIRKRIESDARKSAAIQMRQFANGLAKEYGVLGNKISARIEPLKMEYKDPQFFASQIQDQINERKKMKENSDKFKDTLKAKFSPYKKSEYSQKMNQIVKEFLDEIKEKKFGSHERNDQREEIVKDYVDNLNQRWTDKMSEFVDTLKADYDKEVMDRNVGLQSDYSITVSEIYWDDIRNTALDKTTNQESELLEEVNRERSTGRTVLDAVTNRFWGKDTQATENKREEIKRDFSIQFWNEIQPGLEERYEKARTELSKQIGAMIKDVWKKDERILDKEIQKLNQRIKKLEEEKEKNEELKKEISSLEDKRTDINKNILECRKVGSQL